MQAPGLAGDVQGSLSFAPPGAWLIEHDVPAADAELGGAQRFRLVDKQVDLVGEIAVSHRIVRDVVHSEGLAGAARFSVTYDPSYERLVVHRVVVIRGEEVRDVADPDHFVLLRRETEAERQSYDGSVTAELQIPDVRVGDTIDTWYTLEGANPVLQGRWSGHFPFSWGVFVREVRLRVRAPKARTLVARCRPETWTDQRASVTSAEDGVLDHTWVARDVRPVRTESALPHGWSPHARITVADALDWSDVADLFRVGYVVPDALPESLEAQVAALEAAHADVPSRMVAAFRLVQREIRYVAVNLGEGGFVPRPADTVWARRFGDCKDVSLLLVTLFRRLGVDAAPALVNTHARAAIVDWMPVPTAFDHCIATATWQGRRWWFDATNRAQGGDLEHMTAPWFGYALPLEPGAGLVEIETGPISPVPLRVEETYRFGPTMGDPCDFEVKTTYRAWSADGLRGRLRNEGPDEIYDSWLRFYRRSWAATEPVAPPRYEDDLDANEIVTWEHYRITTPWTVEEGRAKFRAVDGLISADLSVLPDPGRRQPLGIGRPRRLTRRSEFHLPSSVQWVTNGWTSDQEAPGFRGSSHLVPNGTSGGVLEVAYEITAPTVEVEALAAFDAAVRDIRDGACVTWSHTCEDGAFVDPVEPTPLQRAWAWYADRPFWQRFALIFVPWMAFNVLFRR